MKILIACEYSGIVRDAFEDKGWDAWSCDIIPTESVQTKSANKHIQGDVLKVIDNGWDMMIAHPPCTYLSYAGRRSWDDKGRIKKRLDALDFFRQLYEAPIEHICIENPMGCASPVIAKYSQIVEPYHFGDPYSKKTCLWLKNLPQLFHAREDIFSKKTEVIPEFVWYVAGKTDKPAICTAYSSGKERSKFHKSIALAMAEQWTDYYLQN
jgi:hypothetical protein